jgi:hypothetical protein
MAELGQALARCVRRRGRAGRQIELGEQVRHVSLDGELAPDQAFRDLLIAQPLRDQAQDLDLATGDRAAFPGGRGNPGGASARP